VDADRIDAAIDPARGAQLLVDRFTAQLADARPALELARRDPAVHHVDHAAHRAAAVEQRGGALQHLDLVGEDLLDSDRVIRAQVAHVERSDAVLQHQHALAREPANDGTAGARAEEARSDAGLAGEGFAQAARDPARQVVAAQYDGGLHEICGTDPQRAGGDDDFLEFEVLGGGRGRGQQADERQGRTRVGVH
jgi:hypothetical protein